MLCKNIRQKIFFTTSDYNKFTSKILDVIIKEKELVNKSNIWGEWSSGLKCYTENGKGPSSNPTRSPAGLWDPTSLRGSW